MKTRSLLLASLALGLSFSIGQAQQFSQGVVTPANEDTAVISEGTVLYAFNFDSGPTPASPLIDGVQFTGTSQVGGDYFDPVNTSTVDFTLGGTAASPSQSGFDLQQAGGGTDTGGFDTNLSAGFQALNANGMNNASNDLTITLHGLTIGQTYYAQFFFDANQHDARLAALQDTTSEGNDATSATVTSGGNIDNHDPVGAYNPPYIIDEFTATGTSETLADVYGGGTGAQLSGFVLEVPEPSTYAMMALGLLALVGVRRFRQLS